VKQKPKKCPFCKKTNKGYVGKSIYFCCGGSLGEHYECDMCGALWREITEKVVVRSERINNDGEVIEVVK